MRAFTRRAAVLSAVSAIGVSIWACDAKKQTEYVAGVSTQVQVPRDLKTVRVDINVGGANVFCRTYKVYDGRVQLPRSLGSFPASGSPTGDPVTVTVVGFTEDAEDPNNQDVYQCLTQVRSQDVIDPSTGKVTQKANSRILRRSRQPYVKDEILFLPLALKFSCFDKDCETSGQNMTCKGGRCVDAVTDEKSLAKYHPGIDDGTGGDCFSVSQCLAAALPPLVIDPDKCLYGVTGTPGAPAPVVDAGAPPAIFGDGVNVILEYDGGFTREVADKSPDDGFFIPDPTKPQQFQLSPGLCDMVKGYDTSANVEPPPLTAHRITRILASPTCRAKSPSQPLCAGDQLAAMGVDPNGVGPTTTTTCKGTELKPPTSLLMVVADDTQNSELFFKQAADLTVKLSLSDPAFEQTELGLMYTPNRAAACTDPPTAVPLTLARLAKPQIAASFNAHKTDLAPTGASLDLDQSLKAAYTSLSSVTAYRKAVLVIGNRDLDKKVCTPQTPHELAAGALSGFNIKTYVAMLTRDPVGTGVPDEAVGANALAAAGGTDHAYDARGGNQAAAQDGFRALVDDLASCAYDVAPEAVANTGQLVVYQDPLKPLNGITAINFNAGCNGEAKIDDPASNGWGVDPGTFNGKKRVYLCGTSCDDYHTVRTNAANAAALYLQPPPAVPVFLYTPECAPKNK